LLAYEPSRFGLMFDLCSVFVKNCPRGGPPPFVPVVEVLCGSPAPSITWWIFQRNIASVVPFFVTAIRKHSRYRLVVLHRCVQRCPLVQSKVRTAAFVATTSTARLRRPRKHNGIRRRCATFPSTGQLNVRPQHRKNLGSRTHAERLLREPETRGRSSACSKSG
jgi:hypothetical protein